MADTERPLGAAPSVILPARLKPDAPVAAVIRTVATRFPRSPILNHDQFSYLYDRGDHVVALIDRRSIHLS